MSTPNLEQDGPEKPGVLKVVEPASTHTLRSSIGLSDKEDESPLTTFTDAAKALIINTHQTFLSAKMGAALFGIGFCYLMATNFFRLSGIGVPQDDVFYLVNVAVAIAMMLGGLWSNYVLIWKVEQLNNDRLATLRDSIGMSSKTTSEGRDKT